MFLWCISWGFFGYFACLLWGSLGPCGPGGCARAESRARARKRTFVCTHCARNTIHIRIHTYIHFHIHIHIHTCIHTHTHRTAQDHVKKCPYNFQELYGHLGEPLRSLRSSEVCDHSLDVTRTCEQDFIHFSLASIWSRQPCGLTIIPIWG